MENKIYLNSGADLSEVTPDLFLELLENKEYRKLKGMLADIPAPDIAALIEELDRGKQAILFRLLPKEEAAKVFVEMSSDDQKDLIEGFSDNELSEILEELYIDDTVDIIEEMPAGIVRRIIAGSSKEDRVVINRLLNYPKDSAGTVMTTEFVRFKGEMTVEDALTHIRRVAIDKETIYTAYVIDKDKRLVGSVTAKDLLISDLDTPLTEIMDDSVIAVNTSLDKEQVANLLDKYGLLAIPVVDNDYRIVGIITVDDAIDVIKEESEEDFAKMAAVVPTEEPYLKTSVISIWKSRIPWLLFLMISGTFTSMILTGFESVLPSVLILFVPMLMGTGGNSGGQASVTVTRGISLSEIKFSDTLRVLVKELCVGVLCGISLGAVAFGKVLLIDRLLMQNPEVTVTVAMAVALAIVATVLVSKLIGSVLPILAARVGFDPAVMASPLITTIVDAISLVVYYFVALTIMP